MEKINMIFDKIPKDYHCNCKYCTEKYFGELKKIDGTYYSARNRTGYSIIEKNRKHLCPGHWHGYKFVIENFSKENNTIFDPCAGTGTAIIEAAKLNRKGIGIELEFFDILKANSELYQNLKIYEGDARTKIDEINEQFDLIITGTPYNNNSDAPERKQLFKKNFTFNYKNIENLAFLKNEQYYKEIIDLYKKCYDKLKIDGYFVLIIKDTIRNKKPYLLHKELVERMEKEIGLKLEKVYLHKHYPPTLFINTYNKKFPDVKLPKYQTIMVMKK